MIEESKYCSEVMKKHFNKELVMNKEDKEDFKNSTKCWIFDNDHVDNDIKVRDHCHITRKNRRPAYRDCNINVKLNHKIPVVYHNLKSYDSHLIMQKLGQFNFKINVIPSFIDSFQFLSSSLDNLVKNFGKDDFKYLSIEFDNNVLNLIKQKEFYPYEYMRDFQRFKEELPSKEMFYSSSTGRKITDREY